MIDFRIPKDPLVMKAMARYLLVESGSTEEPYCKHCGCYAGETVESESPYLGEAITGFPSVAAAEAFVKEHVSPDLAAEEQPSEAEIAFGTLNVADTGYASSATPGGEVPAHLQRAPTSDPTVTISREVDISHTVAPLPGVELDGEGLPWDGRIHGEKKAKLSKAPHAWKKKRNVSAELVAEVEAELRQALAASPANPILTPDEESTLAANFGMPSGGVKVPAPSVDDTVAPTPPAGRMVTVTQCGAPVEVPIEAVIFPEFAGMCTAAGIPPDTIKAAVNRAGLASTVLLATRMDLIPFVINDLFPVEA